MTMRLRLPTTWRIAWRNLWRNPRRTALALAAIGLSVTLVLLYDGILRWEADYLIDTITGPMLGHVQAHAPEWRHTRAMDKTMGRVSQAVEAVRRDPDVAGVDVRVYAPALAALGEEGFAVVVVGVDMAEATRPSRLLQGLKVPLGGRRVLMGRLLAEQMGATQGAEIAIVGQGIDGSLANDFFTVAALVDTSVDLVNRQAIVMPLADARELFAMGDEAHELVIYARDPARAQSLATRLGGSPELAGVEVLDWKTAAPGMNDLVELVAVMWVFILLLVFVAAAAGVANTALMSTFERTHEFGMLLALGTAPSRIVAMILVESLALGVTGALLGTALGGALVAWAHHVGVDYAKLTGVGPSSVSAWGVTFTMIIRPRLAAIDIVRVVLAVMATAILASAWPALRAARLQPARALRE
ncbi:MAG: FtsX-like permease family protein [Acidobacteriia bacterium]|nr:FtsX-like permease family protein [Terriglobia bacterium]